MEVKLDALCESILYKYEQSGDKAVRKSHVEQAWVTEIIILNRGSKNDIKHIFENE